MEVEYFDAVYFFCIRKLFKRQKILPTTFRKNVTVLPVLLAAILDFLRDSWTGLRTWNSAKQKCYFELESQVCVSDVHPDVMYNHDTWDFICYFGGHFVLQFWKGKTKNRAWHGADLESAYPNCVKTTTWQILLRNALQTLRMPLFEKWALTI